MRSVIFAVLLGVTCAASAQMYRWTDEKGRVHITDTPPPPSAKAVQKKSFAGSGSSSAEPGAAGQPYALQVATKNFPVTLYTAPNCPPCGEARKLLNGRGVPFKEISVIDAPQTEELKKVAGSLSVPTVSVGSSVQKGFEDSAYHALLDDAGYPRAGILPPRSQAEPKPAAAPAPGAQAPAEEESSPASGPYAPR